MVGQNTIEKLDVLRYEQVKNDLYQRIVQNKIKPGECLASERELVTQYGVSRITIRRALSELEGMGVIYKVPGKGAFVRQDQKRVLNNLISVFSFYDVYSDAFYAEIFSGIMKEAHKLGFHLISGKIDVDAHSHDMVNRLSSKFSTDGYLLLGTMPESLIDVFREQNKQIVLIDSFSSKGQLPSVIIDNLNGAHEAVHYLLKLGHKKIAHLTKGLFSMSFVQRKEGWAKALTEAGLDPSESMAWEWDYEKDADDSAIKKNIEREKPTAIFCCNDLMAIHLLRILEDMTLDVPKDISVVGFDNTPFAQFANLTTMAVPKKEMGEIAVKRLINQLNDTGYGPLAAIQSVKLIVRKTTCRPKKE